MENKKMESYKAEWG